MVIDALLDRWSTVGDPGSLGISKVVAHVVGHVNGPKDGCLTMYRFSGREEAQIRNLGWGDKRGIDESYVTGGISPGPGRGR